MSIPQFANFATNFHRQQNYQGKPQPNAVYRIIMVCRNCYREAGRMPISSPRIYGWVGDTPTLAVWRAWRGCVGWQSAGRMVGAVYRHIAAHNVGQHLVAKIDCDIPPSGWPNRPTSAQPDAAIMFDRNRNLC